jgi:hypothetical protein
VPFKVADVHHYDEEQDPDPDCNGCIWIRIKMKGGIRKTALHRIENRLEF